MKPRNPYERQIAALSAKLPDLTKAQTEWGAGHCFDDKIYRTGKGKGWCSHCGNDLCVGNDEEQKCTHCGSVLKVEVTRKRVFRERSYLTIITTIKGFQVCRHFSIEKYIKRGGTAEYDIFECVQNWIDENGRETLMARKTIPFSMYYDVWDRNSDLSIKNKCSSLFHYYNENRYDIDGWVYPRMKVIPRLIRNGFDKTKLDKCPVVNRLMVMLLTDREAEMLMKQGQYALLDHKLRRDIKEFGLPTESVKVASRHGYIVEDASMWLDHIELLNFFGKDIHNPHYICPGNLEAEHSVLNARKARIDAREKLKKELEAAAMWEEQYHTAKEPYFGICFGNGHIVVTVIQSVREMAEEGSAMHHCVYANGYYKKKDSLILTARDMEGNRVETIEVSLKTFEVVQSRGKMNQNTEYHEEILKLVRANMGLIKKPGKQKKAA